jgi:hypothetical protein
MFKDKDTEEYTHEQYFQKAAKQGGNVTEKNTLRSADALCAIYLLLEERLPKPVADVATAVQS